MATWSPLLSRRFDHEQHQFNNVLLKEQWLSIDGLPGGRDREIQRDRDREIEKEKQREIENRER